MTEQQTSRDFEDAVRAGRPVVRGRGRCRLRPARISAHARTAGAGVRWWRGRATPILAFPVPAPCPAGRPARGGPAALAVVGSRLLTPPAPVPGLLALGSGDQILVVDPVIRDVAHAITAKSPHDDYPVWSPDGARLVISQHDGRGKLQLIDADGGNRHPVLGDLTSGHPAAWSPDGTRIAFTGYHYPGGAEPGLYVVDADGTDLTLLVPERKPRTR